MEIKILKFDIKFLNKLRGYKFNFKKFIGPLFFKKKYMGLGPLGGLSHRVIPFHQPWLSNYRTTSCVTLVSIQ